MIYGIDILITLVTRKPTIIEIRNQENLTTHVDSQSEAKNQIYISKAKNQKERYVKLENYITEYNDPDLYDPEKLKELNQLVNNMSKETIQPLYESSNRKKPGSGKNFSLKEFTEEVETTIPQDAETVEDNREPETNQE